MVQTLMRFGAQFDQAALLNNQTALESFRAKQQGELDRLKAYDRYMNALLEQRNTLSESLSAAEKKRALASDDLSKAPDEKGKLDAQARYEAADKQVQDLQKQVSDVNTTISSAGGAPGLSAPPGVQNTDGSSSASDNGKLTSATMVSGWGSLPNDLKDLIKSQIKSPSLPATKEFDNHLTLLYERLTRQLGAINDDISRDPNHRFYLMQFDVGLYPSNHSANNVARVEYQLTGCSGSYSYQLYPGMSAYNIAEYTARSQGSIFSGALKLLNGLGASGDYQRLKEEMNSALTQSVYTSGFGSGTDRFGWYYGPNPSEQLVVPGIRTTYAFIVAPADCNTLNIITSARWQKRNKAADSTLPDVNRFQVAIPHLDETLHVKHLAYDPITYTGPAKPTVGTLEIELSTDIDPNMIVSVGGMLLKRVRDSRGRATAVSANGAGPSAQNLLAVSGNGSANRGLLEADQLSTDTWYPVNPRTLLVSVSSDAAGSKFPSIRLESGEIGRDITDILSSAESVRVGDRLFSPIGSWQGHLPQSTFLPLFYADTSQSERKLSIAIANKKVIKDKDGQLHIQNMAIRLSASGTGLTGERVPLSANSQVILSDLHHLGGSRNWSLGCEPQSGDLVCMLPVGGIGASCPDESECGRDGLPASLTVRVIDPGRFQGDQEFSTDADPVPHFGHTISTEEHINASTGTVDGWNVDITYENLERQFGNLFLIGTDNGQIQFDRPDPEVPDGIIHFFIEKEKYKVLGDNLSLWGWDRLANKSVPLGRVTGVASALAPKIESISADGLMSGRTLGAVEKLFVQHTEVPIQVGVNEVTVDMSKTKPGFMYFQYAGVRLPVKYDGRQLRIVTTSGQPSFDLRDTTKASVLPKVPPAQVVQ
jgi:hypothetical protein